MKFLIPLFISVSLFASGPDFLVLGAEKGGTSSLFCYLKDHPDIIMPKRKELWFFDLKFYRGINFYLKQFPEKQDDTFFLTGDVTTGYLANREAPKRAFSCFPNIKLMALLRNPGDRAFSRYKKWFSKGYTKESFETLINEEIAYIKASRKGKTPQFNFIELGLYAEHLKRWLSYYPKEQLLILISEDFYKNTQNNMDKIYEFLDLSPHIHESFPIMNEGTLDIKMKPETRELLKEFYRPYNEELKRLFEELELDITFKW
jgi:hypothetical protein